MEEIDLKQYPDNFISIYWTKSHDKSQINNQVDIQAKEAAKYVKDNHPIYDAATLLNTNNYIAYNTLKAEINYKTMKYDEKLGLITRR